MIGCVTNTIWNFGYQIQPNLGTMHGIVNLTKRFKLTLQNLLCDKITRSQRIINLALLRRADMSRLLTLNIQSQLKHFHYPAIDYLRKNLH